ncbi:MAG: MopE-related protein [Myxococcota bacterium]
MWIAAALAGELPWECPDVTALPDLRPYTDDAGVADLIDDVARVAASWWAQACDDAVESVSGDTTTWTCTAIDGGTGTRTLRESLEYYPGPIETLAWSYDIAPAAGTETWSALTVEFMEITADEAWGTTASAAWAGALDGFPDDGTLAWEEHSYVSDHVYTRLGSYETSGCAWSWKVGEWYEWRTLGAHTGGVQYGFTCDGGTRDLGAFDGAEASVDAGTWEVNEVDLDGWPPPYDCDDADPDFHPCALDVPYDGIDQNCTGGDNLDADHDGQDADFAGGTDCDDADAATYPGADDAPGDRMDQDCDGRDDVDEDGDGYTTSGDDQPADCDDHKASIHPGARDYRDDGVDQDCDGVDAESPHPDVGDDEEPPPAGDTAALDTPRLEPPSDARCGCSHGASALLLLPLVARRRRQTR